MATEEKYGELNELIDSGKTSGFVSYDEVNELLPDEVNSAADLDDFFSDLEGAGVEILDENRFAGDKKLAESEEFGDSDIGSEFGDKTNDPVRMYLREMGTVPLLTREGEIELARRIERGQRSVSRALSRSSLVIRDIIEVGEQLRRPECEVRELLLAADPLAEEDTSEAQRAETLARIDEIEKL